MNPAGHSQQPEDTTVTANNPAKHASKLKVATQWTGGLMGLAGVSQSIIMLCGGRRNGKTRMQLETANFYERLPEGCHLYTYHYESLGAAIIYTIKVVLLLPPDKMHLTDPAEVRMEMYIQAETLIWKFRDLDMWKNPDIHIAGDGRFTEGWCELYVETSA